MGEKIKFPKFSYPGGKGRLNKWIVDFFPDKGNTYFEPFVGRGNIYWRAALSCSFNKWVLNDIQTKKFFEAILNYNNEPIPERSQEEYRRQWELYKQNDKTAVLLEPYITFSGGGYPAGLGGVKKGIKSSSYQKHLINAQEIMRKTNPVLTDKLYWQENEETDLSWLGQDDFVYLDPPYINAKVLAYKNNTLSHRKMAEDLKNAKFKWLLSEYDNQLYRDIIGPPFATKDVQLSVGFETTLLSQRRIECVWKNY